MATQCGREARSGRVKTLRVHTRRTSWWDMLIDLGVARTAPGGVPSEWARHIAKTDNGFRICGDHTAATEVFVYCHGGLALVADRLEELLDRLSDLAIVPPLSSFGMSALLHHGLIPPPHTEFRDVFSLTMGDILTLTWSGEVPTVDLDCDYPWFSDRSTESSTPSDATLFDLIVRATDQAVAAEGGEGFLMLSSGKDSAAIALALAAAGHSHIPCVTYSSGPDDPEPLIAAQICSRLGLEHRVVELPNNSDSVTAALTQFFAASPVPGTDLAQIPYVLATAGARSAGGVAIDGGGNDSYMGFPVTGKWTAKTRLRIRGDSLIDFAQRRVAVDSPVNYVARSRTETFLSGRMIRFHESRSFFPEAVDTRAFWSELSEATKGLSIFDLYALGERYITPPSSMKKHVLSARAIGYEPSVPWCNHGLADYFFNLPEEYRFDRKRGVNKVLLRSMLLRYLDYDADKIGKHYFAFDGARFVVENMDLVRAEINQCALWDHDGLSTVHGWLGQIESRPLLYHAILTVFMVSGWHNHSRFVKASPGIADVPWS